MRRLGLRTLLWLGFAIVVAHNLEEWLTMGPFLEAYRGRLPGFLSAMTRERFALSLVIVTFLVMVVTWAGARSRDNGLALVLAVAMQPTLAVNAAQHVATAAWAGGYAPGAATGAFVVVPFAVYLVQRALRDRAVRARPLAIASLAEAMALVPLLVAVHAMSAVLARS